MEKTETSSPLVICDAGPLIHLDELACLDLLSDFKSILIPDEVCSEVEHHRPAVFSHPRLSFTRINATQPT
jgi:predicted nucleic acid-binding protein